MNTLMYPRESPKDVEALAVKWAEGRENTHVYIRYTNHTGLKTPFYYPLTKDPASGRCYGLINEGDTIGWYKVWFDEKDILPAGKWPQ